MNADLLVRLHLVAPIDIRPMPDTTIRGRFEKALRTVGSNGTIAVRSRMITAVAGTKFKTIGGLPISLIGLHGKDDLLVLGPAWALENLANGKKLESPKPAIGREEMLRKALVDVKLEMECLERLPEILRVANLGGTVSQSGESSMQEAASQLLQAMFRASEDKIKVFFADKDIDIFAKPYIAEVSAVLSSITQELESGVDNYPIWWEPWEASSPKDINDVFITESGRHFSAYPVRSDDPKVLRQSRGDGLGKRLRALE